MSGRIVDAVTSEINGHLTDDGTRLYEYDASNRLTMEERFREEFGKALKAMENAPDGHWIEASEMAFRNAALIVGREGLELALQAKVDADPTAKAAAFSPSGPGGRRPPTGAQ